MNERKYLFFSLYLSFAVYVLLATINVSSSIPGFNYIVVCTLLFLVFFGVLLFKKIKLWSLFFFLIFGLLGFFGYFASTIDVGAVFPFFYLLLVSTNFLIIRWLNPTKEEVIRLVSICFYIYLSMSIFTFFVFKSHYREISFDGLILDRAFHGIEGSPANIDMFVSLFFLIVLFSLSMSRVFKLVHMLVYVLVVYFCDTQTPLLIGMTWLGYLLARKVFGGYCRRLIVFGMYSVMLLVFYLSMNNNLAYDVLLFVTNGRNYIWNEQIVNVFSDFSLLDFWFGDFSNAYVSIHWSDEDTNNPHNGYIFMLIRLGLLVTGLFLSYVLFISKYLSEFKFFLLISLLAASVANSNVFYLSNPIITFLLVFSVLPEVKIRKYN